MEDKWIDLSEIIDLDKKEEKETEYLEDITPEEFYEVFREEYEEMEKKFVDKKASEILQTLQDKIISQTQQQLQTQAQSQNNEDDVLGKEDIKQIMNYKDDGTALRFLRVATKYGYAAKVGKSYKITRKNLNKFLKYMEGQDFEFK